MNVRTLPQQHLIRIIEEAFSNQEIATLIFAKDMEDSQMQEILATSIEERTGGLMPPRVLTSDSLPAAIATPLGKDAVYAGATVIHKGKIVATKCKKPLLAELATRTTLQEEGYGFGYNMIIYHQHSDNSLSIIWGEEVRIDYSSYYTHNYFLDLLEKAGICLGE